MYQWRPSQWLKWAPLTILPFVAGAWLQTGDMVDDIVARAQAAAGVGAKIAVDGRDVVVTGEVASQAVLDSATKAISDTYGVRTVDTTGVKIVPPVTLMAPTIDQLNTSMAMPDITGTWPEGVATTLSVDLNGKTYELNKDPELTSNAGKWTLKPATAIADGAYDVTASVSDGGANVMAAVAPTKVVIDTVAPAAPTLAPMAAAPSVWPYAITGTWPEAEATGLTAKLADKVYTLGTDEALKSDGKGNFTFDPKVDLKPGSYDLNFTVSDAVGNKTDFASPAAIVVAEGAKAAEPDQTAAAKLPDPVKVEVPAPVAAATVMAAPADAVWPYAITGSFPEAESQALSISLAGKAYALGKDKELISDGKGTYTFMPAVELAPGKYDLDITVIGKAGNNSQTRVRDAIVIAAAAPPAPPPPAALERPTVDAVTVDSDHPMVTGTYPATTAKNLTVALDGTSYVLGTDPELTADGNTWMLMAKKPVANGTYNVVAHIADESGQRARDATQGELVVNAAAAPAVEPAPAPAPVAEALAVPTVEAATSDSDHPTVKGTWPAGKATSLVVTLDGNSYKLGKDFDLLSDASGNWKLKPTKPLVNGTYDVIAQVADAAGQTAMDATKDELIVNVAPPPPAPPAAEAYDCISTMARISAVFPVRFKFNVSDLTNPNDLATNQYAALLKDPRCLTMKVQVAGHADYKGSEAYNQGLSERRAQSVIAALVAAGVAADRLTGIGYSKDKPLDPALNDSARMKNRRVEFTVLN